MALEGLQLGNYRLLRSIGSGGMGEVYLAEDTRISRQVAIKVVRTEAAAYPDANATKEAARLFQREMRAIITLDHPHILPLYDFGEATVNRSTLTYMVMPYRQEGSLADWLQARGSEELLSPQDVGYLLQQAASALQHAHNRQIIHQDVKPSNFLIHSNEEDPGRPNLMLADFGVAKFTSATSSMSHTIRGTPSYMAPEQWNGEPVPATDQYALAIMAYELLVGRPPFQGPLMRMMYLHTNASPEPPSTLNPRIPRALDIVILRALAKKPEDRFVSISAFAQAFQQALQGPDLSAPMKPPQSSDLHATLAISEAEARTGTSRTLTLPGGRRVTVNVPGGAYQGQVIRLEGMSETSYDGSPGSTLIITIAIQSTEEPAPDSRNLEKTDRALNRNLQTSTIPPSSSPPQSPTLPASAPNTPQQPVLAPDAGRGMAIPESATRRRLPAGLIAVVVGLVLLIVVGSAGFFYFRYFNYLQRISLLNAASANPYSGTLALNDPLSDNSNGYFWTEGGDAEGTCAFTGGAYHVNESQQGDFRICAAGNTNFSNFAYEVQMTIVQGDRGGIGFRADDANVKFYSFRIGQDGSYELQLHVDNSRADIRTLTSGSSSAINTGLNQANTIAVVANGNTISLYVNRQEIDSVTDSTFSHGQIGVVAYDNSNPTEVAYSNAQVWTL